MEKRYLLHLLTPAANPSPFDVNMAYDAGWDNITPYTQVRLEDVAGLVRDAIFSRGPKGVRRTGVFLGGRDAGLAMDMLDAARAAMVPPFEVSVFADPSGAFTTAAALVAVVEALLKKTHARDLADCRLTVFGGTGPVGTTAAVLAADAGARVRIVSHASAQAAQHVAEECRDRYGVQVEGVEGRDDAQKRALLADSEVVLSTAKAGVQVLNAEHLAAARDLLIAADVNAVPPAGIEGVGVQDDGRPLQSAGGKALGVGALTVGNVKYTVQQALLERMRAGDGPHYLDFRQAFALAREHAA